MNQGNVIKRKKRGRARMKKGKEVRQRRVSIMSGGQEGGREREQAKRG